MKSNHNSGKVVHLPSGYLRRPLRWLKIFTVWRNVVSWRELFISP